MAQDNALTVRNERLLLWSSNLWALGEGILGPLFAVFAQRIGGNIMDITWAWAIYLGMTGILTIVAGGVSGDIINGKPPCPAWPNDRTYKRYGETGAIDPGRNSYTPN